MKPEDQAADGVVGTTPARVTAANLPMTAPGIVGNHWSPVAIYLPGHPRYAEVRKQVRAAWKAFLAEPDE